MLEEKQQQIALLSIERDELKTKKEWLESQLDQMQYELQAVKLESTATATTTTPIHRTLAAPAVRDVLNE